MHYMLESTSENKSIEEKIPAGAWALICGEYACIMKEPVSTCTPQSKTYACILSVVPHKPNNNRGGGLPIYGCSINNRDNNY